MPKEFYNVSYKTYLNERVKPVRFRGRETFPLYIQITYDRKTIPPLLKMWAEADCEHGGVIFVDEKTIPPSDIGGLIQALHMLFQKSMNWDWRNRICFLRR